MTVGATPYRDYVQIESFNASKNIPVRSLGAGAP
jgi:hypothetical protein